MHIGHFIAMFHCLHSLAYVLFYGVFYFVENLYVIVDCQFNNIFSRVQKILPVLILLAVKDWKKAVHQRTTILKTTTLHFRELVLKTAKVFSCRQTFIGFALSGM